MKLGRTYALFVFLGIMAGNAISATSACVNPNERFVTLENGGCGDRKENLAWKVVQNGWWMYWKAAREACGTDQAGNAWRLPTEKELQILSRPGALSHLPTNADVFWSGRIFTRLSWDSPRGWDGKFLSTYVWLRPGTNPPFVVSEGEVDDEWSYYSIETCSYNAAYGLHELDDSVLYGWINSGGRNKDLYFKEGGWCDVTRQFRETVEKHSVLCVRSWP